MRKIILILLCACLLVSSACSIPFISSSKNDSVDQSKDNNSLLAQLQEVLAAQPTATATLPPAGRIDAADSALLAGQLEKAEELYQEAYQETADMETQARALYGLGRSYFSARNYAAAADAFNRILGQFPNSKVFANAYFMLGRTYDLTGEYLQAAASYQRYSQIGAAILSDYVLTLQGDAAAAGGDYTQAIYAYQAAQQANPNVDASSLNLKIGRAYDALQDYTTSIQYYQNVYNNSQDAYTRSTANLLMGQAYQKLDMPEEAYKRFLDSVYQFPKAYDSFTALSILISQDYPVNEYVRGLVDYYAGSYDYAISAFERYLASNPDDNDGTVYYFLGLSYYFDDQPRNAIEAYQTMIDNYPGNAYWAAAWDEKAYVQWAVLGEFTNAAETYQSFVSGNRTSPDAPNYLFEAARVYERSGDLENAARTWQRLMDEYPSAEKSYEGLFLAGITYYRLGKYEDALKILQRLLVLATNASEKARAHMWIGKCYQALGDADNAQNAFTAGQQSDPTDYYGIRSGQLLEGRGIYDTQSQFDLGYDLNYERPEGEAWLRSTFNIPAETDLSGLVDLQTNQRIQRIQAYWELSLFSQAVNEAELLRSELQGDTVNLYRLMNYLLDLDLYQPAIYACRDILSLAALDDLSSLSVPIFFTHVRFGAYFREMMVQAANDYEIPPLLFYALVRQESMFNPFISSAVGASGLAQIMPATGKENVDLLGWPDNYDSADLLRGEVSIELGAFYLSRMLKYLKGDMQAALAAYNAGAGNAEIWKDQSKGDPDLFLETIRTQETRDYLMQIAEFLNIYELVYTRTR
jgi:soluble lytic murein transglycosylase